MLKISNIKEEIKSIEGDWLNIFDVLELINFRHGMYIGNKKNITALWNFIQGYSFALSMNGLEERSFPDFSWFSTWLKGRINVNSGMAAGWLHHMLELTDNDEEIAYEKFFEYLEEFKKSIPVVEYQRISDDQKSFQNLTNQEQIKIITDTKEVYIFKLPLSKCYWYFYVGENNKSLDQGFGECREDVIEQLQSSLILTNTWQSRDKEEGNRIIRKLSKGF